jgi:hypothetical protein
VGANQPAAGVPAPAARSIESLSGDAGSAGHGNGSVAHDIHQFRAAVLSGQGPSTTAAIVVAIALAQRMDRNTLETFVGANRIACMTRLAERTVRTALGVLREEGWIAERIEVRSHGRVRVRRAMIPPSLPANAAGSASRVPAGIAGTSTGSSDRYRREVPAESAVGTGKIRQPVPATAAGDLSGDHVNDPLKSAGSAAPERATASGGWPVSWHEIRERERDANREKEAERRDVERNAKRDAALGQRLRAGESAEVIASELGIPLNAVRARQQLQELCKQIIGSGAALGGAARVATKAR